MNNNFCIIMAGGIGSRFWPVSKTDHPKQFIDILGTGETLIQQTFNRFKGICPADQIYIVTNQMYKDITLEQLPEIKEDQIICEPERRNTAPCIAYANFKIAAKNPNANIIVSPADHLILKTDVFKKTIESALNYAENNANLITIGIAPSRPDTGYGYIKYDNQTEQEFNNVIEFTEKPQLEAAKKMLESGNYSWNSGMFIWKLSEIQSALKNLLPEVFNIFVEGEGKYNQPEENAFINEVYGICPDISIDYGVMEKATNVKVINADFGWSDLGTWGSLFTHIPKDKANNAVISGNVDFFDAGTNIVNAPKAKKVIIQGLNEYIVVDTPKALLICKTEDEQQIKAFVEHLKQNGETNYL